VALDAATQQYLSELAESGAPPLNELTPEEARAGRALLVKRFGPGPEMARVSDERVPTEDGADSFAVRILVPPGPAGSVIVYYHGGGWVLGSLDYFDTVGRQLAQRAGAVVVLVDYRLAPEHRYPAAARDAWQALTWVDQHMERIAGARLPLVVAGDSAGGNLAAVVTHRARAEGGPAIALQVLIYPVTDADLDTGSYRDADNQLGLPRESMAWFWDHYAPDPASRRNLDVSPLQAADLSGLPPAIVLTAEHDVLRDEGEAYAAKLAAAGVPVRQQLFAGQMHGFFTMVNVLPGSAAGLNYMIEQLHALL
jgi:acetyl esterase